MMAKKYAIDCGGDFAAIGIIGEGNAPVVIAGLSVNHIGKSPHEIRICGLIGENCGLRFLDRETEKDFDFYPVPRLPLFAIDKDGRAYGMLEDFGAESGSAPVCYVEKNGGRGQIALNIMEFLELVVFFPDWREIFTGGMPKSRFYEDQREIADALGVSRNPESPRIMRERLDELPLFSVYSSRADAEKDYEFIEFPSI